MATDWHDDLNINKVGVWVGSLNVWPWLANGKN